MFKKTKCLINTNFAKMCLSEVIKLLKRTEGCLGALVFNAIFINALKKF